MPRDAPAAVAEPGHRVLNGALAACRGPCRSRHMGQHARASSEGWRARRARPVRPAPAGHLATSRRRDRSLRSHPGPGVVGLAGSPPPDLKVLAFDVFGTVVDWRSGVIAEVTAIAREHDLAVEAGSVADVWRRRYQPFLDRVRRGEAPWQVLDELHRASLREVIRELGLERLNEADLNRLVQAWHHLPPWPDAVDGLNRMRSRFVLSTLSNGGMGVLVALDLPSGLPFDFIVTNEVAKSTNPRQRTHQLVLVLAVRPR